VGSHIWDSYTPEMTFHASLIVGLISVPIFALFVTEPKKEEK